MVHTVIHNLILWITFVVLLLHISIAILLGYVGMDLHAVYNVRHLKCSILDCSGYLNPFD